ncbi:hypothetical protein SUGI_1179220 [Cryptomeria japonica]|nr:hypothetical protein SUGI_1179220 [Cryptomeria japonica]
MVHHFSLNCLCQEESLEEQCDRLFDIDGDGQSAIVAIVQNGLSEDRHWCDGHIYEIVLCLLVDVMPSKEAVVEICPGM